MLAFSQSMNYSVNVSADPLDMYVEPYRIRSNPLMEKGGQPRNVADAAFSIPVDRAHCVNNASEWKAVEKSPDGVTPAHIRIRRRLATGCNSMVVAFRQAWDETNNLLRQAWSQNRDGARLPIGHPCKSIAQRKAQ